MPPDSRRLTALRSFATAITTLNVLGYFVLGFEQSWAYPLVALPVAYGMELLLELLSAVSMSRRPRFLGRPPAWIDFLLPAHITGLACSMLLYANEHVSVIAFATAVAIASKWLVRVSGEKGEVHVLNPSNTGIALTLLLFPWVGIAPPYQFTRDLGFAGDLLLPGLIIMSGSFLNARLTKRIPLILAWLLGFVAQALLRALLFETPLVASLAPMTGLAFLLFTFYMVTDPATTPHRIRGQVVFGALVAATYGALQIAHVVFGLFFSLFLVCSARGLVLRVSALVHSRSASRTQEGLLVRWSEDEG